MKTEFLVTIPGEEDFCGSSKAFVEFLKVDSLLTILGNKITYKRATRAKPLVAAKFKVANDKVKSSNERYFHFIIECEKEELAEEFAEMCERLKSIIERIRPGDTAVNTLWDGAGKVFAEKSYPVINEVENLMRRLIAKFMLVTVGVKWAKDAVLPTLWQKIENFKGEQPYVNDLHKLDFIHLSDVLFEKKRDVSLDELDRILLKTKFDEGDQERILKYLPKSNWEKYFSSLVDFPGHKLQEKWKVLYDLRNKVAHNRAISRAEYGRICGVAEEVKAVIRAATEKLGEIDMGNEDRELIINTYQRHPSMEFYNAAESAVAEYYSSEGYDVTMLGRRGDVIQFDLMAVRGDETVAVEVKAYSYHNFVQKIKISLREMQARLIKYSDFGGVTRIHYFYVLRDFIDDDHFVRAVSYASKISSISGVDIKIGSLDDSGIVSIIWASPDLYA
ncbi:hypothetical protein C1X64_27040 [Pseudomonas sp. GW456-E7]|nr:hypothetical protein C1X64_27040 [Pseudomonas sp. GW456-E7]